MKIHISNFTILFLLFNLVSCTNSPETLPQNMIQTAIVETLNVGYFTTSTVLPTNTSTIVPNIIISTPSPTNPFIPTYTLTSTNAPTPTITPASTSTPTITLTPTPRPPATLTLEVLLVTKTELSAKVTSTREAFFQKITETALAKSIHATTIAEYNPISNKELQSYANQHIGEKVVVQSRVFNIAGTSDFQMYYGWTYDAIYVKTKFPFRGLYENDFIYVYGAIGGENCFKNIYNAEICQPLIKEAFFEKR